jgi:S-disulfanyl-L-cysteine oxidoreductase SoxD
MGIRGLFAAIMGMRGRIAVALSAAIARRAVALSVATVALIASASAAHAFPWSIDMFRGAAIQPLEEPPRNMPDGVLATDGIHYNNHLGQPDGLPGADEQAVPQMKLEAMTVKMHNPLQPTPENLKHGEQLFLANCSPCHGTAGAGDGSVVHLLLHKPANLMTGVSKNLPDGYIYGYIRNGGIWMPAYDDAMSSNERWQVVVYLRDLQANYHGTDASASATTPDATGAPSGATTPSNGSSDTGSSSPGASSQPKMNMPQ